MTEFEHIKDFSIDELAEWLDQNGAFDTAPWTIWFNKKYCCCEKCPSIEGIINEGSFKGHKVSMAYCEIYHNCRFFSELPDVPSNKEVIKMWLNSEMKQE